MPGPHVVGRGHCVGGLGGGGHDGGVGGGLSCWLVLILRVTAIVLDGVGCGGGGWVGVVVSRGEKGAFAYVKVFWFWSGGMDKVVIFCAVFSVCDGFYNYIFIATCLRGALTF